MAEHEEETRLLWAVVNTAVDGVILIDAHGVVRMFNPACESLFGYPATEVVGENVKMLMPAPFHAEHDRYLENYTRSGVRKIIGIGREVTGRRKDGSIFPMDLSVGEAKEGSDPIYVGVIHDLTERVLNQRAMNEVVSRLRAVVDTAVDGVILIDARGTILMFNPACERLFGYEATDVIGQNVKRLMPSPFHEQHDVFLDNYHRTGERKIIGIGREVVGQRKDGSTFPMDLSVGEAKQEGASIFVGIIHDLTERKRTEEQLVQAQKMETVGQLSGGIAHDFNNLLTVIIGNAESLGERLKSRPDLKLLSDAILTAGDRGAELTQRLLAFSRRQTLQPIVFDCNRLVDGMKQLLRRALREDIDTTTSLDPELAPAYADPAQLESAILNLALNAQDAMPTGGSLTIASANASLEQLYLDAHPEVKAGPYIMVSITDTGTGMTPEIRERAFEPFFTTKDVGKGSGLGLSMVYGFAKQSNGHVAIYSEVGLGTTVRIYLPARGQVVSASAAPVTGVPEDAPQGSGNIMLVEDDPYVRGYAVACLENLGYRVTVAVDGPEALAQLTRGVTPDLLFTDVVMPGGLSGWDLADRAREMQPGLRILLTSGYPMESMLPRNEHQLETAILKKPYRKAELARRIRLLLHGQS